MTSSSPGATGYRYNWYSTTPTSTTTATTTATTTTTIAKTIKPTATSRTTTTTTSTTTTTAATTTTTAAAATTTTLDAKPLAALHGIIDPSEGAYVVDSNNIQPRLQLPGAFLSAVMTARDGESEDERMARLEGFLDHHAVGWRSHVLHERKQTNILVQTHGEKPAYDRCAEHGILLAGEWVASEYRLADAAADTGRLAGQNIAKAQP